MYLANILSLLKRVSKKVCWWLVYNVPMGDRLSSIVCGVAMGRRGKHVYRADPEWFKSLDTDAVCVSGTADMDGMWVQCHNCMGGFLAFSDYKTFESLVKETMPEVAGKKSISKIETQCLHCRNCLLYTSPSPRDRS